MFRAATSTPGIRQLVSQFHNVLVSMCSCLVLLLGFQQLELRAADANVASFFRFDDWQTDQGLPQNSVTAVVQTPDGYLWLGTYNGLVRFDGVKFRVFDTANTPEFRSSRISVLHVDRQGRLWVGTEGGGLVRYSEGLFRRYSTDDGLADNTITALYSDRSSVLWVGTMGGTLHRFRDEHFTPYSFRGELSGSPVEGIVETQDRELWVATPDALGRFLEGEFLPYPMEPDSQVRIGSNRGGGFWLTINNRLFRFQPGEELEEVGQIPLSRSEARVTGLFEDSEDNLWIATYGGGLIRYRAGTFTSITSKDGLTQDIVLAVLKDREGNLWVGTNGGGLNRLKDRIFELFDSASGLRENVALTVSEGRDGSMWVGTDGGGLSRILNGKVRNYSEAEGLKNGNVWSVLEDRVGAVWVGTRSGLFRLVDGKFERFGRKDGLNSESVRVLYQDKGGKLWIGTYGGGFNRYNQGVFTKAFTVADGLSHNDVRCIFEDREGALWIGTGGGGLNRFKDSQFSVFKRANGLASDFVRVIFEDEDGLLWIGTNGGLSVMRGDKFFNFSEQNGFPDDVISQIFLDAEGYFWIGCNRGIFRVRKKELIAFMEGRVRTYNSVSYDRSDGLGARECTGGSQPAGWRSQDGRLWFPTIRGVAVVDPANLRINRRPPSVVIEDVIADGESILTGPSPKVLPGKERLEFHYTGLSFIAPKRVTFQYRLEGLDLNWIQADSRRAAIYMNVPAGKYTFRVMAANNDGVWNEIGASMAFTVLPPFWKTWWFASISGSVLVLLVWGFLRYLSIRKLRRQVLALQHQHALEKERARIAQDMHDDLGASITQIGLLCELMKRQVDTKQDVAPLADRMIGTSRDVVNTLDEIVWAVNPKNDRLNQLGDYITQYGEDYFDASPIRCRMDVPTDLPATPLSAEMRHNLFMVVKEAFNNIVKHSKATEVWLRLSIEGPVLVLVIEDNGKGFSLDKTSHRRNGLQNMKKRIEESGGSFELTTEPGKGTRINLRVNLPAEKK